MNAPGHDLDINGEVFLLGFESRLGYWNLRQVWFIVKKALYQELGAHTHVRLSSTEK